jgi:ribokinase
LLTLGAEGAVLVTADETLRVSAPRVTAVDTVGAGDVFCGTLIAARAARFHWEAALRAASEAAAICVTRAGVLASFPTRSEMAGIVARGFVAENRV